MKRLLNILIFLALVGAGTYYLFNKNMKVRTYISSLLNTNKQDKNGDSLSSPILANKKNKHSTKKKIPKTPKPDEFFFVDKYAKKAPKQYEKDISTLAQYLIKPAKSDIEKVRALFTWVATHVKYDDNAYNSSNYPDYSAENVLKNKKAVCEGYSNILKALCEAAGLEAEKINGYAKGYGYKIGDKFTDTDHAWNAVKVDNNWRLFDATWASGFGTNKNGKLISTSRFDPFWFDVNPKAFIFSHFPEDNKWQLMGNSITLTSYEKLPYLNESIFKLGCNPNEVFANAFSENIKEFVEAYPMDFPIKVIKLPYSRNLNTESELIFEIESEYAEEIVLIDGDIWYNFEKKNNTFTLTHKPLGKEIRISVKINWFDKDYYPILEYKLIKEKKITEANTKFTHFLAS
jgi:hypothetical protein